MNATTQSEKINVNAQEIHGLGNQHPSSCNESLEKDQRLVDLSYDSELDLVVCLICQVRRKKLYFHLRSAHNLSQAEYLAKYNNARLYCNSELSYRNSSFIIKGQTLESNKLIQKNQRIRNGMKKFHEEFWISNTPEVLNRSMKMSIAGSISNRSQANHKIFSYKETIYKLRSNNEFVVVKLLVDNNFEFKYEELRFWIDNTIYIPDFYVPSLNLIIECKGSYWLNKRNRDWNLVSEVLLDQGYKFLMLVDFDNINKQLSLDSLLDKLTTSGSAIIYA
jgi:very-short-patch-repair endonuclease